MLMGKVYPRVKGWMLQWILLTCFSVVQPCYRQLTVKVKECPHYRMIELSPLPLFGPNSNPEHVCRNYKESLQCVFHLLSILSCPPSASLAFDSQNSAVTELCGQNIQAYKKSSHCFSKTDNEIKICLGKLANSRAMAGDPCGAFQASTLCVQQAVLQKTVTCTMNDAILLGRLVSQYLVPFRSLFRCKQESIDPVDLRAHTRLDGKYPVSSKPPPDTQTKRPYTSEGSTRKVEKTEISAGPLSETDHRRQTTFPNPLSSASPTQSYHENNPSVTGPVIHMSIPFTSTTSSTSSTHGSTRRDHTTSLCKRGNPSLTAAAAKADKTQKRNGVSTQSYSWEILLSAALCALVVGTNQRASISH